MQFTDILGQQITNPNSISDSAGLEIHREILINKRLSLVSGHLTRTARNLNFRFAPLFLTYAHQNWPSTDSELFDDTLDFVKWLDQIADTEISNRINRAECNWLYFLKNRAWFVVKHLQINRKLFAFQILYRTFAGPRQIRFSF